MSTPGPVPRRCYLFLGPFSPTPSSDDSALSFFPLPSTSWFVSSFHSPTLISDQLCLNLDGALIHEHSKTMLKLTCLTFFFLSSGTWVADSVCNISFSQHFCLPRPTHPKSRTMFPQWCPSNFIFLLLVSGGSCSRRTQTLRPGLRSRSIWRPTSRRNQS